QAEDGIRDFHVTGVQTCALPISAACAAPRSLTTGGTPRWYWTSACAPVAAATPRIRLVTSSGAALQASGLRMCTVPDSSPRTGKIGRASCREREEDAAVGRALEE